MGRLADLWAVRAIAIARALIQIAAVTAVGFALSQLWGWSAPAGLVLGFALSIASTVVLLRSLTAMIYFPPGTVTMLTSLSHPGAYNPVYDLAPDPAQPDPGLDYRTRRKLPT